MSKKYINLLPPAEQKLLKFLRFRLQFLHFTWFLIGSLAILALLLLGVSVWLKQASNRVSREVAGESKVLEEMRLTELPKRVQELNQSLENFQILENGRQEWSGILLELARTLPPQATLDSISIDRMDKKIEISGRAASRESVLRLRANLLNSDYFLNVNFPLENLESAADTPFKYRFYYNPEKLP